MSSMKERACTCFQILDVNELMVYTYPIETAEKAVI